MVHKKQKIAVSQQSARLQDDVDPELERRVDEMMSVDDPKSTVHDDDTANESAATAPQATSAPEVPSMEIPGLEAALGTQTPTTDAGDGTADEILELSEKATAPQPRAKKTADNPEDDPTLGAMVDDIVATESDELLQRRDAEASQAVVAPKPGAQERIKNFFKAWWGNKLARYGTFLLILVALGIVGGVPATRYYVLNGIGVRSGASLTIVDDVTLLPLKNVMVEIGGQKSRTNADGVVRLSGLELGPQSLSVSQVGFASLNETVVLGLGSNPLGDYKLMAVGIQFRVTAVDYLTDKPLKGATLESEQSNAKADEKGQITLTIDAGETEIRDATLSADGYRSEKLILEPGERQNRTLKLVQNHTYVYVSKQSGTYDVYRSDIDGKNRKLLLAGSGNEDDNITVVQSPGTDLAAIVSRRTTLHNQDGYPLQTLTMIDVDKGTTLALEQSESLRIVDWRDGRIVYLKTRAGASAGAPDRQQLISYNYETHARQQLASANDFRAVLPVKGMLYYATSNNYQGGVSQFARIRSDNTGKQIIVDKTDFWGTVRTDYDTLRLITPQNTQVYKFGDTSVKQAAGGGQSQAGRYYFDSDDQKHAAWIDNRDGKGTLLVTDLTTGKDVVVTAQAGLSLPLTWLDDSTLVYRIYKTDETADYAVSLKGGAPKKMSDVTNSVGLAPFTY